MHPETKYTREADVDIAYQVFGTGDIDMVLIPPWICQLEHLWREPRLVRTFERFGRFSRVILFDRRGTGLSARSGGAPTLDAQMDDVLAVMEAAGSERAAIFGHAESAALGVLFAATHPDRAGALVLFCPIPRIVSAPDYPWAHDPEERARFVETIGQTWGTGAEVARFATSSATDRHFLAWAAELQRLTHAPREAAEIMRMVGDTDVRDVLPSIQAPTLVLSRPACVPVDHRHSLYVAEHIPNSRLVELAGEDALFFIGDADEVVAETEEFLTGTRTFHETDRVLATVMFADIVGSTERAAKLGDSRWRDTLGGFFQIADRELGRFKGRQVKSTGDGFLATFDGPARAIRCALSINSAVQEAGLELRTGLHTGECELIGDDVGGVAVHIAARVTGEAGPGEVLATRTVTDLVAGSGFEFEDRGEHELRGVPGSWQLLAAL